LADSGYRGTARGRAGKGVKGEHCGITRAQRGDSVENAQIRTALRDAIALKITVVLRQSLPKL